MKRKIIAIAAFIGMALYLSINGCASTQAIQEKSGAQLWGENCNRCHSAPTMDQYSGLQWDVIGEHMTSRACLTDDQVKKIVSFLKTGM